MALIVVGAAAAYLIYEIIQHKREKKNGSTD